MRSGNSGSCNHFLVFLRKVVTCHNAAIVRKTTKYNSLKHKTPPLPHALALADALSPQNFFSYYVSGFALLLLAPGGPRQEGENPAPSYSRLCAAFSPYPTGRGRAVPGDTHHHILYEIYIISHWYT